MQVSGLLIDLDGVVYLGDEALPGAVAAVQWLERQGVPHLFLTNTTSRPRAALVEKLARVGIRVEKERILTPPVVARRWIEAQGAVPVALFVPEATRVEFAGLAVGEAGEVRSVVVGDLGEGWDFPTLNHAFRLLMARDDCALLALGMTRYWRAPDGLRLDAGPFVQALAYASGKQPVVMGKPARAFFIAGCRALGLDPQRVAMLGDDVLTDVGGAQEAGLRGVLVQTGKFRPEDLHGAVRPDACLPSLGDLPRLWPDFSPC